MTIQSEFNLYKITYIIFTREIRVSVCLPITQYSILTNNNSNLFLFFYLKYSFSVESVLLLEYEGDYSSHDEVIIFFSYLKFSARFKK